MSIPGGGCDRRKLLNSLHKKLSRGLQVISWHFAKLKASVVIMHVREAVSSQDREHANGEARMGFQFFFGFFAEYMPHRWR